MNRKIIFFFLVTILLFTLTKVFFKIMTSLDHNEHMYITASILTAQNNILYKDFAYVQMPYLPLLYGSLIKSLNITSYYLLAGKFISFLSLCFSTVLVLIQGKQVLKDINLSLSIVILFLLNPSITDPSTEVSNYIMPVFFSLASFYIFNVSIYKERIGYFGLAFAGFLLAIAIGIKLTYATIIVPFVIFSSLHLLTSDTTIDKRKKFINILLSFLAGLVIGLLPVVLYLADIKSFIFNNLVYHSLNTQWRQDTGFSDAMSLKQKISFALVIFLQPNNLILISGILIGVASFIYTGPRTINRFTQKVTKEKILLPLLLSSIAILTALIPTPSISQYFIMPISFLFILLIFSQASKSDLPLKPSTLQTVLFNKHLVLILVLVSLVYNIPSFKNSTPRLDRSSWSGIYIHDVSLKIRKTLIDNGIDTNRKIATLSPLYIIEANLPIYPELTTGPFTYRIGDFLSPEEQRLFVVTSPNSIWNLLDEDKPSAIFVGFEGKLDKPLIKYAKSHGYKKVDDIFGGGELYIISTDTP